MPKHIFTIELDKPLEDEEISEIIVISNKGISHKATILHDVHNGIDGSSYEINLSHYVRTSMKELSQLSSTNFYLSNFLEYIEHFSFITIDFSHNHLTDEYLHNIMISLQDERLDLLRQKLVKINIEQNRLTKLGFLELFQYIKNCPNFKELEADINLLGVNGYRELKEENEIPKCIKENFVYHQF